MGPTHGGRQWQPGGRARRMKVFVLNCGSSSVKYKLFDMSTGEPEPVLASGRIERIGTEQALFVHEAGGEEERSVRPVFEHRDAIGLALNKMAENNSADGSPHVSAIGHR